MPSQDLIEPPGYELGIVARDGAVLNHVGHAGEGLPEVATVGAALQQRLHRGIEVFQMGSEFGSIHAASIGRTVSPRETRRRRLRFMDAPNPSLFEQLQQRLAATSEPLEVLNQFEAELLFAFPGEAAVVVELVSSWGHRLGVLTHEDLEGYV